MEIKIGIRRGRLTKKIVGMEGGGDLNEMGDVVVVGN